MELSKISPMQGILGSSPALGTSDATAASGPSFLDVLKRSLNEVNASQTNADAVAQQFQTGQGGVSLEDAMVSMQKANISFQEAVQVRNKLVTAYTDVMNMQI
ncbi:MAG: flagellar hook-basal body complex protein FliE [Burkholderiaceae bacterium]|jgi:flagellar hook-basal body complex protein FliE